MTIPFHDAANIFPLMGDQEFAELVADICKHGQREPIWTYQGAIIDGRNRYRACLELGFPPIIREWEGPGSITAFVISLNLHRRHLTESQRALVGARIRPLFEAEARERMLAGKAIAPSADLREGRKASEDAAEAVNVSARSVESAARVLAHGAPALVSAVETGVASVSAAAALTALSEPEQREVVARGEREILDAARRIRNQRSEQRRIERIARIEAIAASNAPLSFGDRRFPVLYGDPAWRYEFCSDDADAIENHYPTMALEEICALPVAEVAADDAILYLWATSPKLEEALQVVSAWGFTYRTCMVWVKDRLGMGYWARQRHELLLVATRGEFPAPAPPARPDSVITAPRAEHSRKPAEVAEMLERLYPELGKVELFCRQAREGWAVWGNQAGVG